MDELDASLCKLFDAVVADYYVTSRVELQQMIVIVMEVNSPILCYCIWPNFIV
jgi:hypothetical protein